MKKLCKRMLALVTALVLVAGIFHVIPAFGSGLGDDADVAWSPLMPPPLIVTILSSATAPGQYVDVVLFGYCTPWEFNTLGFTVVYDSNILQSISVTPGTERILLTPPAAGENPMHLNLYSANPLENSIGAGPIAVIRFRIHDNAPSGPTPITVTATHAYFLTHNLDLEWGLSEILTNLHQGTVNVCPLYCECLNCVNESDLPNLLLISPPFPGFDPPGHVNRWQAHIGDWRLPTTARIVVASANPGATANISWGSPIYFIPPAGPHGLAYMFLGTVELPDDVINNNDISLIVRGWVTVGCSRFCDCPICEYEAWRAEIERQRIAYEEWRAWEAAVAQAQAAYQEYRAWRTEVEEAEAAHQAYLDWLAEIERQRVAYEEWHDWLCTTNQCGGCDRCN